LESPEWIDMTATLALQFIALKDVELPADAPDVVVWQRSQEIGALRTTRLLSKRDRRVFPSLLLVILGA
jgi:hypothetical protein